LQTTCEHMNVRKTAYLRPHLAWKLNHKEDVVQKVDLHTLKVDAETAGGMNQ